MKKIKWSRKEERDTPYKRNYPDSGYHRIVTKKAKFFGQLMKAVLIAGGHPRHFRPYALRHRTMEEVLDSLLPNNVDFKVTYDFSKCKHYDHLLKAMTLPDGEGIEVCTRCGMSRSIWEHGESNWMKVDIEKLISRAQKRIDKHGH